jgi:DNA-binding NarL/FixJ family response regulator
MLAAMGADGFAERARIELDATGEHIGTRVAGTADVLTPQEAQIVRLVGQGYRNRDVTALFLSPATVDFHLRKVFRKLGMASRTQLANTLMTDSS